MGTFILPFSASTPPRTLSRHVSTRPVTPVFQSRPTTPIQGRPTEQSLPSSSRLDNLCSNDLTASPPVQKVKDEPGGEAAHIRAQLIENHLASTQAAESRRPDYLKRMRRLAPSNSTSAGRTSLTSDLEGKDGSLLWSSANVGVIDSPVKGKRIALFQETSEESFEESLMAGGYGRYVSWFVRCQGAALDFLSGAGLLSMASSDLIDPCGNSTRMLKYRIDLVMQRKRRGLLLGRY